MLPQSAAEYCVHVSNPATSAMFMYAQVAVKRLRVLDIDDVRAPNEQYAADGSGTRRSSRSVRTTARA